MHWLSRRERTFRRLDAGHRVNEGLREIAAQSAAVKKIDADFDCGLMEELWKVAEEVPAGIRIKGCE